MTAGRAGIAPADVYMMAQVTRIKGQNAELWAPLDESKLPNAKNLEPHFVQRYPDGRVSAIGAVSWYITLVTNTDVYPEPPTSWKALWDPANEGRLGLLALVSNSFLLEITAKTWFGGTEILEHRGGHPRGARQARRGEAERARSGTATRASSSRRCRPARSRWASTTTTSPASRRPRVSPCARPSPRRAACSTPAPGASSKASQALEEAHVFIDYMCRPDVQAKLSRKVGTAPTVKRDAARPHRRGVRGGRERHPADHPALRPVRRAGRLAQSEVDRDDRGLTPASSRGQRSACRRRWPRTTTRIGLTARSPRGEVTSWPCASSM